MSNVINIIVWGYNKEEAYQVVEGMLGHKITENFNTLNFEDYVINIFIRYHDIQKKEHPKDLTDILILSVNDNTIGLAKEYLDKRRGIPFRFITGGKLSEDEAEYVENIINSKEVLFRTAINHDKALKEVFLKIDLNKNGYLDRDEIIKASKELNHDLLEGDANEIIAIMGDSGKISYDSFRNWWHMGRLDFASFRSMVTLKLKLTNFIDNNLNQFQNYLESISSDIESSGKDNIKGKISLIPVNLSDRVNHQTSLNLHLSLGDEYDKMKHNFPLFYNEAATFGIEIPLKSKDESENMETLKTLDKIFKVFFISNSPLANLHDKGFQFNSRLQGDIAIYEFCFGGFIGDILCHTAKSLKLDTVSYSTHSDSHISTQISIKSIFDNRDIKLKDILKDLIKLIIEHKQDAHNLKLILDLVETALKKNFSFIYNKVEGFISLLKSLLIIKNFNFSIEYSSDQLYNYIIELPAIQPLRECPISALFEPLFEFYDSLGPGMFLEELFMLFTKCDMDKISLFASTPLIRAYAKLTIILQGLDSVIEKPFKSS